MEQGIRLLLVWPHSHLRHLGCLSFTHRLINVVLTILACNLLPKCPVNVGLLTNFSPRRLCRPPFPRCRDLILNLSECRFVFDNVASCAASPCITYCALVSSHALFASLTGRLHIWVCCHQLLPVMRAVSFTEHKRGGGSKWLTTSAPPHELPSFLRPFRFLLPHTHPNSPNC